MRRLPFFHALRGSLALDRGTIMPELPPATIDSMNDETLSRLDNWLVELAKAEEAATVAALLRRSPATWDRKAAIASSCLLSTRVAGYAMARD